MTSWMSQANSVEQSRVGSPQQADLGPSRQIPLGVVVGVWDCVKSGGCGLLRLKRLMGLAVGSARPERVKHHVRQPYFDQVSVSGAPHSGGVVVLACRPTVCCSRQQTT